MSSLTAANAEDDDLRLSREVFGQMFTRLKFNAHLVGMGFCKKFIKDMDQNEYDQYLRLLWMLNQMADHPFQED